MSIKSIIPYYLTQILYKQSKFDELIEYAPTYMDSITEKRKIILKNDKHPLNFIVYKLNFKNQ